MKSPSASCRTIDEYIAGFPQDVQNILQRVRSVIREAAPGAVEAMKYGIPTFVVSENLVHFAGCKQHLGFYPTPSAIARFKDELSSYPSAKGSVQFPFDRPIPYDLIRRITQFRVQEALATKGARKRKKVK